MRKNLLMALLSVWVTSSAVWAATEAPVTTTEEKEVTRGYLRDETVGIKPQLGVLVFTDQQSNSAARAAYGVGVEGNLAKAFSLKPDVYMGVSTGLTFAHLGDPTSNLFGSSPDTPLGSGGANLFFIPANLKVGYNFTDAVRVSVHGGGNIVYRSVANSIAMGDSSSGSGSVWRLFPNIGADFEWSFGKNVALFIRPDLTFTPGDELFAGMASISFNIT